MKAMFAALWQDKSLAELKKIFDDCTATLVYGLSGTQKHTAIAACHDFKPRPLVILVHNQENLQRWQENLRALLPYATVLELPELDMARVEATAKSVELAAARMNALGALLRQEPVIVLATAAAAVQKGMSKASFESMSLEVSLGAALGTDKLKRRLSELGYENVPEVEHMGQFSSRGGILDVFPINSLTPLRVEFFGDEIDSIREYNLDTKRSSQNINRFSVLPLVATDETGKPELFLSFLAKKATVIFDEPLRLREQIRTMVKENPEIKSTIFKWEDLLAAAEHANVIYTTLMLQQIHGAQPAKTIGVTAVNMTPFQQQMDLLYSEITGWLKQKMRVLILLSDPHKADSLRELLTRHRIPAAVNRAAEELNPKVVNIETGALLEGFELPGAKLAVVTEKDIFGRQKRRLAPRPKQEDRLSHFREIKPGDYVVHVSHGIGKYLGVETLEVNGIHKDYLHIKYGGDDKLFVPTDQVQLLQKYIGSEGEIPRLHRMGGTEWVKAKAKAKASVEDIAQHLIKIYAKRRKAKGIAFSPDDNLQREFEDAFPFEETPDQLRAIEEIKKDMESEKPMDRLLCGDVGFGKTEVAARAAFKAAMDGKQVAVLVPTTVLAQQHYQTFSSRFMNFPPKIDVVCRFRTAKEQKETLKKVALGQVDILIGTHAILNQAKVKFHNLGLLIVDEEQRFGVKQKEKIRSLSAGVDVLTLSATPIPRTLHMSLVGARDMSIIETAPENRFPVQTYVIENNDEVLAAAIRRELKRKGQIYFIYNRVETIDIMRDHLAEIVPEARIMTAHGQMAEELLERVMMDFFQGTYDILLATSIVENGLDVANANTIIVYNADRFGLSQLYQMRGRVGRSHRLAFAYFVYQGDKMLSETAEKRLQAMKEFAELGAGFKIAMRDLEIRGAGNLLGAEQHGHIATIGFEMYCKLLEDAVHALQQEKPAEETPEPVVSLQTEAYIDDGYVSDAMHKIELYQRIAAIRTEQEITDLTDELIDRFGEPSPQTLELLNVARIKNYARELKIRSVTEKSTVLDIVLTDRLVVPTSRMQKLTQTFGENLRLLPHQNLLRFKLAPLTQKRLTQFVLRVLRMMHDDRVGGGD